MRRPVSSNLSRLTIVRVSPAFISVAEAAASLASLEDRLDEPPVLDLAARIAWLCRPTILPGWRWA
jgi:hypothetical protein